MSVALDSQPRLRVATRSGKVEVIAEQRTDLLVTRGTEGLSAKTGEDGAVCLTSGRGGSQGVTIRVPDGTNLVVGTASGDITLRGRLGAVRLTSESGSIEVDEASAVDARSLSGNVTVGRSTGPCRVQTRSGRATIERCDDRTEVSTESGHVTVANASGDVRVRTTQGRVDVLAVAPGNVAVQTISGKVKIALPPELRPKTALRSASGSLSSGCEEGEDCRVAVQTLSGSIEVVPA